MATRTPAVEDRYEVVLKFSEKTGTYVARAPEIPLCASWGKTQEEAVRGVRGAIRSRLDTAKACGDAAPEPAPEEGPPGAG